MEINSYCPICSERFSSSYRPIGVYYKCGHLIHEDFCCTKSDSICPICSTVSLIKSHNVLGFYSQNWCNIISVSRCKLNHLYTLGNIFNGLLRLFISIPMIFGLGFRLITGWGLTPKYIEQVGKNLINLLNIRIECSDESIERLHDSSYKRILIANHTSFHDALVIGSLFDPINRFGFVGSEIVSSNIFGQAIMSVYPHVIVKPGISSFSQISSFFSTYPHESRLIIFPEGMLTHHKSIGKFRSGAFVTGYPVQPIIIKYKQNVFDLIGFDLLLQPQIDVEVIVEKPIDSDGSDVSIEKIRDHMSFIGEFFLSNVSNKKSV